MADAFLQFILTKKCLPFIISCASRRSLTPEGILPQKGELCRSGFFITVQDVLNKSIITALCVALCVVLPMALHAIPKGGVLFSPMHLPVLLCGLVCGAPFGLICGILGPFVSSILTGMPAFGYMPIMMIELGLYGLISGLVMQLLRSGKLVIDLYAALIIAMLGGRVITGILRALIFAGGSYSWSAWATGYFVSCLPGIILQLILLPTIYVALERAHLLPVRYAAVSATAEAEAA